MCKCAVCNYVTTNNPTSVLHLRIPHTECVMAGQRPELDTLTGRKQQWAQPVGNIGGIGMGQKQAAWNRFIGIYVNNTSHSTI